MLFNLTYLWIFCSRVPLRKPAFLHGWFWVGLWPSYIAKNMFGQWQKKCKYIYIYTICHKDGSKFSFHFLLWRTSIITAWPMMGYGMLCKKWRLQNLPETSEGLDNQLVACHQFQWSYKNSPCVFCRGRGKCQDVAWVSSPGF